MTQRPRKSRFPLQVQREERYVPRVRFKVVGRWLCGLAILCACGSAEAAEVTFRAPPPCDGAQSMQEQIERLIGRPLTEARDADFDVILEQTSNHGWRATVRTKPRDAKAEASEREFSGRTCAEVSDAAAVAIAMAIEQRDRDHTAEAAAASENSKQEEPPHTAKPPPAAASPKKTAVQESSHWRALVGLHGALEAGALPNPSPGAELDLSVGFARFRATLLGTLLAPQTKRFADGKGGEFQLALVGLLACGERRFGSVSGRACLGFELGRLSAEGVGVAAPRIGSAAWRAARVDVGAGWPVSPGFWITLGGALVAPLTRQTFVLNGSDRIFRPSSFGARGLLGVELEI